MRAIHGDLGSKTRAGRWAAASLLLVAAGWLFTPHPVPLYDGLGFPDEPYRYVAAPAGAPATKPPGIAQGAVELDSDGASVPTRITSNEVGPQVDLYLPNGEFSKPVTVKAIPKAPTGQAPDATLEGNVYLVGAAGPAGPLTFDRRLHATISMRAPSVTGVPPVMEYRAGQSDTWRALPTQRIGQDIFSAPLLRAGEYALAVPEHASTDAPPADPDTTSSPSAGWLYILLGGTLALMTLIVLGLRVRAQLRGSHPDTDEGTDEASPPAESGTSPVPGEQ